MRRLSPRPSPMAVSVFNPTSMDVTAFLIQFGYLAVDETSPAAVEDATAALQHAYGLPVTGALDEMTTRALARTPRCGLPDTLEARDALNRWAKNHLRYFIEGVPRGNGLTTTEASGAIARAFGSWSQVCGLTFERVELPSNAEIIIGVGRGSRSGFDGSSGTLAWAELPPIDGFKGRLTMRFDLDENFVTVPKSQGILLQNVACHEIGHLLGLNHTNVNGSLMLPTYSPMLAAPQSDDIRRAQTRYGQPKRVEPAPAPAPGPTPSPTKPGDTVEVQVRVGGTEVYAGVLNRRAALVEFSN